MAPWAVDLLVGLPKVCSTGGMPVLVAPPGWRLSMWRSRGSATLPAALHTADSIRGGLRCGRDSAIIPPHERKGDCDGAGGHRARDSRL